MTVHTDDGPLLAAFYACAGYAPELDEETLRGLLELAIPAAVAAVRADRDRLAGQVAAIRALADELEAEAPANRNAQHLLPHDLIRAALVASSPTTPQPPEVSE